ncbi:MAG TPA: YjjG family noncanonical pyrimidine nucleotidase [Defluviitaleaceae bacterium]|jgi:putative hydrolase of the HAD superfamily|nr:noncanonical pyrimidine nucleotidase, YjjG family [Candidatus Epulonipiscium sp.]HOA80173.1 YjjG family noncanonical pyrimidine nucleotidase [Defluviitaleaceae bacterium]
MLKAIFFDWDNTLWNHDLAQEKTIEKVYDNLIKEYSIPDDKKAFAKIFDECNQKVWDGYKKGELSHAQVRINRFIDLIDRYNIKDKELAMELNEIYLSIYPTWPFLIDGAKELLEGLKNKYPLGIISNGFPLTQDKKVEKSNVKHYFNWFIYSEAVGKSKPHRKIFEYALGQAKVSKEETIFIGDDFEADIIGAKKAGIKTIWFKKQASASNNALEFADYIVTDLNEIADIVKSIETC